VVAVSVGTAPTAGKLVLIRLAETTDSHGVREPHVGGIDLPCRVEENVFRAVQVLDDVQKLRTHQIQLSAVEVLFETGFSSRSEAVVVWDVPERGGVGGAHAVVKHCPPAAFEGLLAIDLDGSARGGFGEPVD